MATIKLQPSGKVVIKDGKVACGCCAVEGCCMYPAEKVLNGTISANDLPDSIKVYNGGLGIDGEVFGKVGNGYYLNQGDGYQIEAQFIAAGDYQWRILVSGSSVGQLNLENPGCLIDIWPVEGEAAEDQFADTYTVSGPTNGTVARESGCIWSGTGLTLTNFGYQWKVNGNNKSGFQNTPVGSYGGGYFVS